MLVDLPSSEWVASVAWVALVVWVVSVVLVVWVVSALPAGMDVQVVFPWLFFTVFWWRLITALTHSLLYVRILYIRKIRPYPWYIRQRRKILCARLRGRLRFWRWRWWSLFLFRFFFFCHCYSDFNSLCCALMMAPSSSFTK